MPPIPVLDARGLRDEHNPEFSRALLEACRTNGCFYLEHHGLPDRLCDGVLQLAGRFFELPEAAKNRIHIRHSPHFRGYSVLKNERDWREQMHYGPEFMGSETHAESCDYEQLIGPNQWPETLGETFRSTLLSFFEETGRLGGQLLAVLARGLHLPEDYFDRLATPAPYNLLKLICYYPQPRDEEKPGVAPHCDWSWITLLLQDDRGGLEIQTERGDWQAVEPRANTLFVNLGELVEMLSGGQFRATAHRVFNPSEQQRRLSVPVFINPSLAAVIKPLPENHPWSVPALAEKSHVHRVVEPGTDWTAFRFGESEWRRKGLGRWCYQRSCLAD